MGDHAPGRNPPQFTLKQLEYFDAVADSGSFSAAAEALYISQSAIATAVTELERILGTRLLIRKKAHGIQLTPAGAHFLEGARGLLRQARELQLTVDQRGDELVGPVAVGCYSTLAATALPRLIDGFTSRYPHVTVSFVDGAMPTLEPLLANGKIDVLITYQINLEAGLEEAVLFETETHVLLPADHPLAGREQIDLLDLANEPYIMFDLEPSARHSLDVLQRAGVNPHVAHRTGNFELVRSMVARGQGFSLLVQRPDIEHSYEGLPLVTRRIVAPAPREKVVIVWRRDSPLSRRATAFVDYARETLRAPAWPPLTEAEASPSA